MNDHHGEGDTQDQLGPRPDSSKKLPLCLPRLSTGADEESDEDEEHLDIMALEGFARSVSC